MASIIIATHDFKMGIDQLIYSINDSVIDQCTDATTHLREQFLVSMLYTGEFHITICIHLTSVGISKIFSLPQLQARDVGQNSGTAPSRHSLYSPVF